MIAINDTSRLSELIISNSLEEFKNIIRSGRWLNGQYTEEFSRIFSEFIGVEYCLPVANGTDALEIALRCLSKTSHVANGEVISVANAGGYTSTACQLVGLKPIYIDIDEHNLLMDISQLSEHLSDNTIAVVVTHLYGRAVDVPAVREELDNAGYHHVKIVEDCAQAHGAKINGQRVGSFGDIATFSFYPTKNLGTVGDAGSIVTSNIDIYKLASQISQYGWNGKYNIEIHSSRNSRMDELHAAILISLLPDLDRWNSKRREIYRRYIESSSKDITLFHSLDESNVVHLAIVMVNNRDVFINYMKEKGISTDIHYPLLDVEQPAWDYSNKNSLDKSYAAQDKIVTLPCFPTMSDQEIDIVCDALRNWNND
ncbi:DegT/DnrJ/EryC1/StrS family aminotransferase [Vibrio palustris]|uniref:dTDP-3-amino-3, 6-dideoxy-alpha-D-galactopyranose transaminase n=1 Tax=Vibrio palustris TaxID=1918946 RepID=A0A1R4B3Q0_9VIBR|nr:DegT/DnrJ/EryC1/StrS family aminotransferase [Vibrio palustris]SJL83536.1 dTDP-3-amino-3, 6-dideoxy-alpha-D-galactopyranose transaminase [Vibrio palustris]